MKRRTFLSLMGAAALTSGMMFTGCGAGSDGDDRKIVRIGHVQSQTHPDHLGLEAFANYINEKLGDKYRVEVYPSELLGSQTEMVQLTQTGAIDFVVASTAIMETFSAKYQIFNLPYLFSGVEAYHEAMDDPEVTDPIFKTTSKAGLETVAWLDAGTRNFYTIKTPINQPSDLKGLKIRVQQSPTNVEMMRLLGGTATPMGFGDVYTALQAGILDGAENNELALTDNGHGDICKYYSYDMHQMVPDLLVANYAFLNGLSAEERAIFEEGFQIVKSTEQDAWEDAVAEAKDKAENEQHVNFIYPDTAPFQEAMAPCTIPCWQQTRSCSPFMIGSSSTTLPILRTEEEHHGKTEKYSEQAAQPAGRPEHDGHGGVDYLSGHRPLHLQFALHMVGRAGGLSVRLEHHAGRYHRFR